jgi:hypothetical protein
LSRFGGGRAHCRRFLGCAQEAPHEAGRGAARQGCPRSVQAPGPVDDSVVTGRRPADRTWLLRHHQHKLGPVGLSHVGEDAEELPQGLSAGRYGVGVQLRPERLRTQSWLDDAEGPTDGW